MNQKNPHERIISAEQAELEALKDEEMEVFNFTPPELLDPESPEEAIQVADIDQITTKKSAGAARRRAELVYMLLASGNTRNKIAQDLGCTPQTITNYMRNPEAQERIEYHRERLYGRSVKKRVESLAHRALDRVEKTIDDEAIKPETRFSAATYILDHSLGKPKQTVEHQGNILGEIMDRINGSRVVGELSNILEAPKDELDTFAEDFAPKHIVGVRNHGEESESE